MGGLFERGEDHKIFLVICHILVVLLLLISYFLYATHKSNRIFLKDKQVFVN